MARTQGLTESVRKIAKQWPRSEITCNDVFALAKPKYPGLTILPIQNLMATHKKIFQAVRWETKNGRKRRVYQIIHGQPERRNYTTALELGESVFSVIEDRNERIEKLKERLKDFSSMVEENKLLKQRNQELNEKLLQKEGRHFTDKDLGLKT